MRRPERVSCGASGGGDERDDRARAPNERLADLAAVTNTVNFDPTRQLSIGGRSVSRELALPTVARVLGLELYIHARK